MRLNNAKIGFAAVLALGGSYDVAGQGPQALARFDVASLKPTAYVPASGVMVQRSCKGGPGTADPTRYTCSNAPLKMLICLAYGVQFYQVIGADWIGTEGYDISANIRPGATKDQFDEMLKNLLDERLHLRLRTETREVQAYSLGVSKGGFKLSPVTAAVGPGTAPKISTGIKDGLMHIKMKAQPMAAVASFLTTQFGAAVADDTGVQGRFDFDFEFVPYQAEVAVAANGSADREDGQSVFAVLRSLGLELKSKKQPHERWIVTSADRMPEEN